MQVEHEKRLEMNCIGNFHRQAPSISSKYHNFKLDQNIFLLLDLVNIVSESSKSIAGSS